jgi:dTDP-4-dehydrorhamnose reductase
LRIVILGASGLIGSALATAASSAGHDVIGTYSTRARPGLLRFDLTRDRLGDLVPDVGPDDAVVLMAAQIDQAWIASHVAEAHRINVEGAIGCAEDAFGRGAHVVFMSTEAVFGAGREEGFDETALPAPLSVYARHKAEVETFLRQAGARCRWSVARTGSNVGWDDNDIHCSVSATYRTLLGPSAKMAYDNMFTVSDVADVAAGLLRVAERRFCGFIHLVANPAVTRTQLADWIRAFSKLGPQVKYEAVPFSMLRLDAPRAARAWLRNERAVRELALTFADPQSTVRRKVELLDQTLGPELTADVSDGRRSCADAG